LVVTNDEQVILRFRKSSGFASGGFAAGELCDGPNCFDAGTSGCRRDYCARQIAAPAEPKIAVAGNGYGDSQ
jgi:hypothetical protein